MTVGGPAVVVDTNVFGAELTRRGAVVADAYREHVEARELFLSFVTECSVSGHPLGQKHHEADRWVAATARWLDVPLVAHDAVFLGAPGITVVTELARG